MVKFFRFMFFVCLLLCMMLVDGTLSAIFGLLVLTLVFGLLGEMLPHPSDFQWGDEDE